MFRLRRNQFSPVETQKPTKMRFTSQQVSFLAATELKRLTGIFGNTGTVFLTGYSATFLLASVSEFNSETKTRSVPKSALLLPNLELSSAQISSFLSTRIYTLDFLVSALTFTPKAMYLQSLQSIGYRFGSKSQNSAAPSFYGVSETQLLLFPSQNPIFRVTVVPSTSIDRVKEHLQQMFVYTSVSDKPSLVSV